MIREVFAPRPGFHWLRGHRADGSGPLGGQPGVFFRNIFGKWFDLDSAYGRIEVEVQCIAGDDREVQPHYIGPVELPKGAAP